MSRSCASRRDIIAPVIGVVVHRSLQDGKRVGTSGGDEALLDRRHGADRLAEREGERGADFQDRKMRRDKVGERASVWKSVEWAS